MANYPYTIVPKKLVEFLEHIQRAGVPTNRVNRDYLSSAGFKSSNDQTIISVLKFIGFLDSSSLPTEKYKAFRNTTTGPKVLAESIHSSYSSLFQMYPDAHQRDTEALRNFFSSHTTAGEEALSKMVSTFQSLCSIASFDKGAQPLSTETLEGPKQPRTPAPRGIESFVINIQLTLPATSDGKIYEEFFKAMKKHLLEGKE